MAAAIRQHERERLGPVSTGSSIRGGAIRGNHPAWTANPGVRPWISQPDKVATMKLQATFIDLEDINNWHAASCFRLGHPSVPSESAVAAVGIWLGAAALYRVDIFASAGRSCFKHVRCVGELVYIGYGQQVAVFSPGSGTLASHSLDGYFGHLFTASDLTSPDLGSSVLVASASELLRFGAAGQLLWRKSALGIDGVVVQRVQADQIFGEGEWDPPGGWQPFRLHLDSGDAYRE